MRGLDLAVFYAINRWPDTLTPLFYFISECTKWLPVRIFLLSLFLAMIGWQKTRKAAICAVIAFPLTNELCDLLKDGFQVLRPCVELADVTLRVNKLTSFGTASAHSGNMSAIALVMTYYLGWKWGLPWMIIALLSGLSRIYVGVHYPSQVLLGWTCGVIVALLTVKVADWIQNTIKARREARAVVP